MIEMQDLSIECPGNRVPLPENILNELINLDPKRYAKGVSFFGGHPLSVTKKDVEIIFSRLVNQRSPYLVCEKTDGVRYLLIVTNENCYFISREGSRDLVAYESKVKIANNWVCNPQEKNFQTIIHILDGEMIRDMHLKGSENTLRYLIFDALVCFNKLIIKSPLSERLSWIQRFSYCNTYLLSFRQDPPPFQIQTKVKDFFRLTSTGYVSSSIKPPPNTIEFMEYHYIRCLPHENDGLIFNDETKPYVLGRNDGYLKWKPAHLNTVDFLLVHNENLEERFGNGKRVMDLYLGWRDMDMTSENVKQNVYRTIFFSFTVVEEHDYEELKVQYEKKYQETYEMNPNEVTEEHFGLIAECKYENVTDERRIFSELFRSSKDPQDIRADIMKQRNQEKELQKIKKLQGEPMTKFWKIFRIRNDKSKPNDYDVVFKIEESIKDDIKVEKLIAKNKDLNEKARI